MPGRISGRLKPFLFLSIVWSVAGAFLLLEALGGKLLDVVLAHRTGGDLAIAIPRQSDAARSHCEQVVKDLPPANGQPQVVAESKLAAWRLGQQLGTAGAVLSAEIAAPEALATILKRTEGVTNALGVPELRLPDGGRAAYALRNLAVFLQEDPHCVAAAFEDRYSAQHAALYKFGAAIAIAAFYRQIPDIGEVFGPEIATFGSAASVPSALWQPLLQPRISVPPGADLKQTIAAIVDRIDREVRTL